MRFYTAFLRPHLEYCDWFWASPFEKDIDKLDHVQGKEIMLAKVLRTKSGQECLRKLGVFCLEKKRFRGHELTTSTYGKERDRKTELVSFLRLQRVASEPRESNYKEIPMNH